MVHFFPIDAIIMVFLQRLYTRGLFFINIRNFFFWLYDDQIKNCRVVYFSFVFYVQDSIVCYCHTQTFNLRKNYGNFA